MEIWDLYDKDKNKTGELHQRGIPVPPERYHIVIHCWIKNAAGEYLIQKRSDKVERRKGIWSFTGGSALSGETSEEATKREVMEEIGYDLNLEELKKINHYFKTDYFVDVYLVEKDIPIEEFTIGEEVADIKYVTQQEIETMIKEGLFDGLENDYFKKLFA